MVVETLNLSSYSVDELDALAIQIKAVKKESRLTTKQRYQAALAELVSSIQEEAETLNVALKDVSKALKAIVSPADCYRHPTENKSWSGRGKKPGWLVILLDNGETLDSLKVA